MWQAVREKDKKVLFEDKNIYKVTKFIYEYNNKLPKWEYINELVNLNIEIGLITKEEYEYCKQEHLFCWLEEQKRKATSFDF